MPVLLAPRIDSVLEGMRASFAHPDKVHDLRVAIRRLRTALSACRLLLKNDRRRALDSALRREQRQLGNVREWDVFMASLQTQTDNNPTHELRDQAARKRKRALRRLKSTMDSTKIRRLTRSLDRLKRKLPEIAETQCLFCMAHTALDRRHIKLSAVTLHACGDRKWLHQLRIQVKKLRYTIELFAALYPASIQRRLLSMLRRLQDELGAMHDLMAEKDLILQLRRGTRRRAASSIAKLERRRFVALRRRRIQLDKYIGDLTSLQPFWHVPGVVRKSRNSA